MKGKKFPALACFSYLALLSSLANRPLLETARHKLFDEPRTNSATEDSCSLSPLFLSFSRSFSSYVFLKCLRQGYVTQDRGLFSFRGARSDAIARCIERIKAICDIRVIEIMMDFKINVDDSGHSVIVIYLVVEGR